MIVKINKRPNVVWPDRKGEKCNLYKDGRSKEKLYNVWFALKNRLNSTKCKAYKYYGKRGITMCIEWYDYVVFRKWAHENGYSENLTLERLNTDGNYCSENCTWATMAEQVRNRKNTVFINYLGKRQTIMEWCNELGLKYGSEKSRIYRNLKNTGVLKLSIQ